MFHHLRRAEKLLATVGTGPCTELLDLTRKARTDFAQRHNYRIVEVKERIDPSRPPAWDKIPLLRDLLDRRSTKSILWLDADATFVDTSCDPDNELGHKSSIGIVVHRYLGNVFPNTGVLCLRRSPLARDFLGSIWQSTEFIHHQWWDNAAALQILGFTTSEPVVKRSTSNFDKGITELDGRWNAFYLDPHQNPAILHFPGSTVQLRRAVLGELNQSLGRVIDLMHNPNIALGS